MSKLVPNNDPLIKHSLLDVLRQDWLLITLVSVLSFFVASWLMGGVTHGWLPNTSYPYTYGGDSYSYQLNIMRNIEAPWYYYSERIGFPFGSIFLDYPASDNGSYLVIKLLGWLTGSSTATFNLYFLLSFPVVTAATYVVSRALGLNKSLSVAVALLYCFTPFHIGRIGHLFFTWYFVVPIYIYYGLRMASGEVPFFQAGQAWHTRILDGLLLMVLASFGVYYAVFACIVFLVGGLLGTVSKLSVRPLLAALAGIGFVVAGVLVNVAPSVLHTQELGKNLSAVNRLPLETDLYGLKIAQMFVPHETHRNEALREFATFYRNNFLLVNENASASLGFIGAAGFIILIAGLFLAPMGIGQRARPIDRRVAVMGAMALALVLISTIGGFATFFALFISPAIRSWNRTSIFIGFLSLAGLALVVQLPIQRLKNTAITTALCIVLALLATYYGFRDQTAKYCPTCGQGVKAAYEQDQAFAKKMQSQLPKGGGVYTLPYISYPDTAAVGAMDTYAHMRLILNAPDLNFSYGGMMWREGDWFYRNLARRPMADQIAVVRLLGMHAVAVNRHGYYDPDGTTNRRIDNSKVVLDAVAPFASQTSPTVSADQVYYFYKLDPLAAEAAAASKAKALAVLAEMGYVLKDGKPQVIDDQRFAPLDFTQLNLGSDVKSVHGLAEPTPSGRWTNADIMPSALISFSKPLPARFTLALTAHALGPNANQPVTIKIGDQSKTLVYGTGFETKTVEFSLGKRVDVIEFSPHKPVNADTILKNGDTRHLGIELQNLKIVALP
jgi:phosphoglycerol transferase